MEWTEYHYHGLTDHDDPTKYENQVRQTGRFTATVWALHVDVLAPQVARILEAMETAPLGALPGEYALTGEYTVEPRDGSRWVRLTVYYRASRFFAALTIGRSLAREVYGGFGGDYVITPAGNWNDGLVDASLPSTQLPKGGSDGPATEGSEPEDQGKSGE